MATPQWNSASCCILIASYVGNGTIQWSVWILAMTPVSCVVLSSKLDIRSQKPTPAFYLLKRLATTVLGQRCFQRHISRCLWVHRAQRIAPSPPQTEFLCTHFMKLLITYPQLKRYPLRSSFLFHTSHLTLWYVLHTGILSVTIFYNIPCWGFTKWKASISTCQTGSCSYRRLSYGDSCQVALIPFLAFCVEDFSCLQVKFSCLGLSKPFLTRRPDQCPCACRASFPML